MTNIEEYEIDGPDFRLAEAVIDAAQARARKLGAAFEPGDWSDEESRLAHARAWDTLQFSIDEATGRAVRCSVAVSVRHCANGNRVARYAYMPADALDVDAVDVAGSCGLPLPDLDTAEIVELAEGLWELRW